MPQNNNSDLTENLIRAGRLSVGADKVPSEFSEKVVYVADATPNFNRVIDVVSGANPTTTGAATLYTTSTTKDFYLTNLRIGVIKDSTCDIATGIISITANVLGVSKNILTIPVISLTAQSENANIQFEGRGMKLDRGAVVSISGTFSVGVMVRTASVFGYEVNP